MGKVPIKDSLLWEGERKNHKYLVCCNPCVAQAGGALKNVSRLR